MVRVVHFYKVIAKVLLILKFRTFLESLDYSTSKSFLPFFSKVGLKGPEFALKFCFTQKRTQLFQVFLFYDKVLAPYRKREILEITVFSFGVKQKVQKFRANSGLFRPILEKNGKNDFDVE